MELAEPSIKTAFERCVSQGATQIICHPFFLSPGRHVIEDIPNLVSEASKQFPNVDIILTEPLGSNTSGILELINLSILHASSDRNKVE